jgi:hypothetical protein
MGSIRKKEIWSEMEGKTSELRKNDREVLRSIEKSLKSGKAHFATNLFRGFCGLFSVHSKSPASKSGLIRLCMSEFLLL